MLFEWLDSVQSTDPVSWSVLAIRHVAAAIMGGVITVCYLWKRKWVQNQPLSIDTRPFVCVDCDGYPSRGGPCCPSL